MADEIADEESAGSDGRLVAIIADIMACLSVGRQNVCGCVSACWKDLRAEIEHQRKTPDEMWLLFVVGMVSKGV